VVVRYHWSKYFYLDSLVLFQKFLFQFDNRFLFLLGVRLGGPAALLRLFPLPPQLSHLTNLFCFPSNHTDKKEKKIFPHIYMEIQKGTVAKSYMRKGFLIYEEMSKFLSYHADAVGHI
jgi:hypothetical protein